MKHCDCGVELSTPANVDIDHCDECFNRLMGFERKIKTPKPFTKLGSYTTGCKGPGYIARMYGGPVNLRNVAAQYPKFYHHTDFEAIERRMLGMYAGYDPYNHFGKYAGRR